MAGNSRFLRFTRQRGENIMRYILFVLAGLAGLASGTAFADEDARLQPGIHLEIPFGGPRALPAAPRLTARLDYRAVPVGASPMPALLQWQLTGERSAVELFGVPLVEGTGYRVNADADTGTKVQKAVGIGVGATLVVGGLAVWALSEALGSFGEDFGEAMGESIGGSMGEAMSGEGSEEGSEPEPCSGIEVGEDCVGGS
jgi:hypothetical protein